MKKKPILNIIKRGKIDGEKLSDNMLKSIKIVKKLIRQKEYSIAIRNLKNIYYILNIYCLIERENIDNELVNINYELLDRNILNDEIISLELKNNNYVSWNFNFITNFALSIEVALITGYSFLFIDSGIKSLEFIGKIYVIGMICLILLILPYIFIEKNNNKFNRIYQIAINELKEELDRI